MTSPYPPQGHSGGYYQQQPYYGSNGGPPPQGYHHGTPQGYPQQQHQQQYYGGGPGRYPNQQQVPPPYGGAPQGYPQQQYPPPPQQQQQQHRPPPPQNYPSASSSASGATPASGSDSPRPDALPEHAQRALAAFGSPYAHSSDWATTREDAELFALPQQAFKMRLKLRFARSPGDIFNPPAPSWNRSPSPNWSYSPFEPISIKAEGKLLADGFKPLYPGRTLADHDVSAADWARFLEDISVAGRLSGGQSVLSNVAPVTMHLGATGYFITKAIEKGMKKKKIPVIAETVEMWQKNFFIPRRLDVYIIEANERLTAHAPGEPIPGIPVPERTQRAHGDRRGSDSSSDSDSSDSSDSDDSDSEKTTSVANTEGLSSKQLRRQKKRERKAARRTEKRERKDKRRENKKKRKEAKRSTALLIIAPLTSR